MSKIHGAEPRVIASGDRGMEHRSAVHRDPEILEGAPVFVGTRVPSQTLIDYLEEGQPLAEFLADFPTVSRDQAIAALEEAKEAVLAHARTA
jgi:uncharacterized protein (DUF433 family)